MSITKLVTLRGRLRVNWETMTIEARRRMSARQARVITGMLTADAGTPAPAGSPVSRTADELRDEPAGVR